MINNTVNGIRCDNYTGGFEYEKNENPAYPADPTYLVFCLWLCVRLNIFSAGITVIAMTC